MPKPQQVLSLNQRAETDAAEAWDRLCAGALELLGRWLSEIPADPDDDECAQQQPEAENGPPHSSDETRGRGARIIGESVRSSEHGEEDARGQHGHTQGCGPLQTLSFGSWVMEGYQGLLPWLDSGAMPPTSPSALCVPTPFLDYDGHRWRRGEPNNIAGGDGGISQNTPCGVDADY